MFVCNKCKNILEDGKRANTGLKGSKWCRTCKYSLDRKRHTEIRRLAIEHYSNGKMRCMSPSCQVPEGAYDLRCLTIDHIDGEGKMQRKSIFMGTDNAGYRFYLWLKRNGYPIGLQVLCFNCQWIKRHENKEWLYKNKADIVVGHNW